jgi:hypothetical protein
MDIRKAGVQRQAENEAGERSLSLFGGLMPSRKPFAGSVPILPPYQSRGTFLPYLSNFP